MNHERFFGGTQVKPSKKSQSLPERVITLIEEARRKVASAANVALVYTYYEIGRMIVEDEQGGKERADYGKTLLTQVHPLLVALPCADADRRPCGAWLLRKRGRRGTMVASANVPANRIAAL